MNKKILILVAIITVFGFGSATALIVPIGFSTSDNVKMYTKTTSFPGIGSGVTLTYEEFCDVGDTVITAYVKDFQGAVDQHSIAQSNAIEVGGLEGYRIRINTAGPTQDYEGIIICAKIVQNNIIGGLLLQPDTTALFLAYGMANAIWIAPTIAGLAAGIYLTKNKWRKNE